MSEDADSDTVKACPECDVSTITRKSPSGEHLRSFDEEWRCRKCGTHFDDPIERPPKPMGRKRGIRGDSLAARLLNADPSDVSRETATPDGHSSST